MKSRLIMLVVILMLSSCMSSHCPTYGSTKGPRMMNASSKKATKPSKNMKAATKERQRLSEME